MTLKIILGDAKSSLRDNCLPEREREKEADGQRREEKRRENEKRKK